MILSRFQLHRSLYIYFRVYLTLLDCDGRPEAKRAAQEHLLDVLLRLSRDERGWDGYHNVEDDEHDWLVLGNDTVCNIIIHHPSYLTY